MTTPISIRHLTRRYHGHQALDDVSLEVGGPTIVGLLGRNGAGKSTLMRILAAHERPTAGSVSLFGEPVWENDTVLRRLVLVREDQEYPDFKVRDALRAASWFHRNWSSEAAGEMAEEFELPTNRAIKKLSRGMRSALGIVIGLASRADVTLLDEPYAGLDPFARRLFYNRLLADYAEYPRTILLSTHLIDEAAGLMERIVLIDHGGVVLDAPSDAVRGGVTAITGSAASVDRFVADRTVWDERRLGSQKSVVMAGVLDEIDCARGHELHLDLRPLSLQDILIYAARKEAGTSSPKEGAWASA
jgi:ABC-2 type transport system ATP-binding protein